jgi:hypothetical protein
MRPSGPRPSSARACPGDVPPPPPPHPHLSPSSIHAQRSAPRTCGHAVDCHSITTVADGVECHQPASIWCAGRVRAVPANSTGSTVGAPMGAPQPRPAITATPTNSTSASAASAATAAAAAAAAAATAAATTTNATTTATSTATGTAANTAATTTNPATTTTPATTKYVAQSFKLCAGSGRLAAQSLQARVGDRQLLQHGDGIAWEILRPRDRQRRKGTAKLCGHRRGAAGSGVRGSGGRRAGAT